MGILKAIGLFIQNELLGMKWLDRLVAAMLESFGMDLKAWYTASLRFFIYDTIKILLLLSILIFIISYIQSYFPPERTKDIRKVHWCRSQYPCCFIGYNNTVLFLFFNTFVHWVYLCWIALRCYFFIFDFFSIGRFRIFSIVDKYLRIQNRNRICGCRIDTSCYRRNYNRETENGKIYRAIYSKYTSCTNRKSGNDTSTKTTVFLATGSGNRQKSRLIHSNRRIYRSIDTQCNT